MAEPTGDAAAAEARSPAPLAARGLPSTASPRLAGRACHRRGRGRYACWCASTTWSPTARASASCATSCLGCWRGAPGRGPDLREIAAEQQGGDLGAPARRGRWPTGGAASTAARQRSRAARGHDRRPLGRPVLGAGAGGGPPPGHRARRLAVDGRVLRLLPRGCPARRAHRLPGRPDRRQPHRRPVQAAGLVGRPARAGARAGRPGRGLRRPAKQLQWTTLAAYRHGVFDVDAWPTSRRSTGATPPAAGSATSSTSARPSSTGASTRCRSATTGGWSRPTTRAATTASPCTSWAPPARCLQCRLRERSDEERSEATAERLTASTRDLLVTFQDILRREAASA